MSQITEDYILCMRAWRRGRDQAFGEGLFCNPAWDILLELFASHLGDRTICSTDLATSIGLPATVVMRWLTVLASRGIIFSERRSPIEAELAIELRTVTTSLLGVEDGTARWHVDTR